MGEAGRLGAGWGPPRGRGGLEPPLQLRNSCLPGLSSWSAALSLCIADRDSGSWPPMGQRGCSALLWRALPHTHLRPLFFCLLITKDVPGHIGPHFGYFRIAGRGARMTKRATAPAQSTTAQPQQRVAGGRYTGL